MSDPFTAFFNQVAQSVNQQYSPNNAAPSGAASTPKPSVSGASGAPASAAKASATANPNGSLFSALFGDDPFTSANLVSPKIIPPIDIYEEEKSYTLVLSIPGASKENVTIDFNKDTNELIIKGEIPAVGDEKSLIYSERSTGKFQRSLRLPSSVSGTSVSAKVQNGILFLSVPKIESGKNVHRISIGSSDAAAAPSAGPTSTTPGAPASK